MNRGSCCGFLAPAEVQGDILEMSETEVETVTVPAPAEVLCGAPVMPEVVAGMLGVGLLAPEPPLITGSYDSLGLEFVLAPQVRQFPLQQLRRVE